jgi:hypothetical protein
MLNIRDPGDTDFGGYGDETKSKSYSIHFFSNVTRWEELLNKFLEANGGIDVCG